MNEHDLETNMVNEKVAIDKYMYPEDGTIRCEYKALPHMLQLETYMIEYVKSPSVEIEVCCVVYSYLAECFTFIPYLPKAAQNYSLAVEYAAKSGDATLIGEIPEYLYNAAKIRNTIDRDIAHKAGAEAKCTDCSDLIEIARTVMPEAEALELIKSAEETARRSLYADSVEHTVEYLNVLFDMHTYIDKKLSGTPRAHGYCHMFWSEKRDYLKKHGISWSSPSLLNPRVKFD